MILSAAALLALAACSGGTIGLVDDPERAGLVHGVIDGEAFVMRHASTMRMHHGHYRFALVLFDIEVDECTTMPDRLPYLRVGVSLPLEVGTWFVGDPEIEGGSMTRADNHGIGSPANEGWARVDEVRTPWEDGEAWVSGALELRGRDGSWVEGRFEEVPLCYFEP